MGTEIYSGIQTSPVENRIEIARAYRFCRETTRLHAKSFYFCSQFLKAEKQRAIYTVYALCRHVDDAVDEVSARSEREARAAVEKWQRELDAVYRGDDLDTQASPVLIAWRDMLRRYQIAPELPLELMRGVLMDTYKTRYESWDELKIYCYRVASVIGLISSEIFGYSAPQTLRYAECLGLAMQLTNILRDIGEDYRMGRIYLPQDEMARFRVTEEQIAGGSVDDNFRALMRFEIARARELYAEAERGIPLLERDARFTVLLAARLYARILEAIERNDFNVFNRRAHLSFFGKLRAAPRIWREAKSLNTAN